MKQKVNLLYHHENQGHGNFGDELSLFIVEKLINKNKYELVVNQEKQELNLICIGSYMHAARRGYYIYGTGIRTLPEGEKGLNFKELNVCALRGPITYNFLTQKRNIKCPVLYGDPGLLLLLLYKPFQHIEYADKIALIPHKSNYNNYLNKGYDKNKFLLINPRDPWRKVVNLLYSCKSIVSASLHGLIVADAYSKPNIMLSEFKLEEGYLKFKDYFFSQKRKFTYIKNLEEYNEDNLYKEGNKIDLQKLKEAFPFQ